MTRGLASRLAAALAALAVLVTIGAAVFVFFLTPAAVPAGERKAGTGILIALASIAFAIQGGLVARRQPGNRVGWMLIGIGLCLPLGVSNEYVVDNQYAPALFPAPAVFGLIGNTAWYAALALLFSAFLYFPDGTLLSRRWRWASRAALAAAVVGIVSQELDPQGLYVGSAHLRNPIGIPGASDLLQVLFAAAAVLLFGVLVAGIAGQVLRYRRGGAELRQQLRLVIAAVTILAGTVGFLVFTASVLNIPSWVGDVVYGLAYALVPLAIGIAILRYRLYEVDLVISRTLVYLALAAFITLVYVGIVVGLGSLIGTRGKPNLALSILATALVAIVFQPLRERLQRLANRLVYGRRASPYEVLSDFGRQLGATYAPEQALQRLAQILAEGTGADRAEICLGEQMIAAFPPGANGTSPGEGRRVEVRHQGELLGALVLRKRRGEALVPADEKLLRDLANQAGLVLHNVGLNQQLLGRLADLRASRQRLVQAQDEERRRLERDLHDGAQQHLVALKVRLGLVQALGSTDPDKVAGLLGELQSEADATLETMRELARGIYPPLLAERGLKEALESQARRATLPVTVEAENLGRYPQEVEAATYFCCLEALQNVQKYAQASNATVRLSERKGILSLEVADDGVGFDPATTKPGAGLANLRDRLDALGGNLTIGSQPGTGTTIRGAIPVPG